ncbi:MAG: N utilization substance protein B [bacterium]|nr:MAG: N utilization substance protein B [bacterium]
MGKRQKSREIAFQGIYQYDVGGLDLAQILKFNWINNKKRIPLDILLFAETLISGTIYNITEIDKSIRDHLENWDFSKISPVDRSILRFSIYSLLFQEEIPFVVTINEAINISRKFGGDKSFQFVNGILDGFQKKHAQQKG